MYKNMAFSSDLLHYLRNSLKVSIFRIWHQKRPSWQPWFGGGRWGGGTGRRRRRSCCAPLHAMPGGGGEEARGSFNQREEGEAEQTPSLPLLLIQSDLFCSLLCRRRLLLELEEEEESPSAFMGERKRLFFLLLLFLNHWPQS